MTNIESMKGKIRNFSGQAHLSAQEVLQMYFFERFLDRLAKSEYKENFVIKGGFLIASLIGIQNRTTMDMDTTVKGIPLREETIKEILTSIVEVDVRDDINFHIAGIDYIREDDDYENFRVSLYAVIGRTKNPMKLDITTGDAITPRAIEYAYPCMFSEEKINVLAYPLETILAEKYESIIKRNIATTRMRDFYDLYTLYRLKEREIDEEALKKAVERTAARRNSLEILGDYEEIIEMIREDAYLQNLWTAYLRENRYIGEISFNETVEALSALAQRINKE
ncbi:nucleotidyl transferase AbiEii/AbiGii toxin family protein [Aedoeadaptatus coli]|uniref:nucleotidyl transferase AbiEii/AbiGii toxin family protein n=1 Tax=Aedoeadaptatus coli TaxID=2058292 RepID=UPI000D54F1CB|nr:nucleotidyl transferase AbiEii/AbiGii toxin family protein [Peptoniphilus coli]